MESVFQIITSVLIGVCLSASCGFRVFVPLLVMSIAVKAGFLQMAEGWDWVGSWPALITFSVASVTEAVAFYIPVVANLLDTIATPAAVVAGTIATAACVSDMHPLLQWSAAVIAGGGIAGTIQVATAGTRWTSTITTGGLGDFVVATVELVTSIVLSVLAVVVPLLAGVLLIFAMIFVLRQWMRFRARRAEMLKAEQLQAGVSP